MEPRHEPGNAPGGKDASAVGAKKAMVSKGESLAQALKTLRKRVKTLAHLRSVRGDSA